MASSRDDTPEYVSVVCPTCSTRLHPRLQEQPGQIKCPDCFMMVAVPGLDAVLAAQGPPRKRPNVGTYEIRQETEERPRAPTSEPDYVKIVCPHCACQLHPDLKDRPQHVTCPDCLEIIDVPSRAEAKSKHSRRRKRKLKKAAGSYAVASAEPPVEHVQPLVTGFLDGLAEIRSDPPPPIPRWTFFSEVFNFPWRADTALRWVWLSIGLIAVGEVAAVIYSLTMADSYLVIPFFALPIIWLSLWTFSFAAACWTAILEDTAAGNDRIHNWPESDFREWVIQAIYLGYTGMITGFVAWGASLLATVLGKPEMFWPIFGCVFFVLYPFVLLSSLEAGTPWNPVSRPVARSLRTLWWGWLLYYGLSVLLLSAYLLPLVQGVRFWSIWLTPLLTAPLLSAIFFIHGRILGRLAWRGIVHQEEEE